MAVGVAGHQRNELGSNAPLPFTLTCAGAMSPDRGDAVPHGSRLERPTGVHPDKRHGHSTSAARYADIATIDSVGCTQTRLYCHICNDSRCTPVNALDEQGEVAERLVRRRLAREECHRREHRKQP